MIVASRETWAQECDYAREVQNLRTYAALLGADSEAALLLQAKIRVRGVGVRARSG